MATLPNKKPRKKKNNTAVETPQDLPVVKKKYRFVLSARHQHLLHVTLLTVSMSIFVMVGLTSAGYGYFLERHHNRFYPGVHIGGLDLSGMTYKEALDIAQARIDELNKDGLIIQYPVAHTASASNENSGYPTLHLTPVTIPLNAADNERIVYSLDIDQTLRNAFAIGRSGNRWENAQQQYWAARYRRPIQIKLQFDDAYVKELLNTTFATFTTPATNADIHIQENGEVQLVPESLGKIFDIDAITDEIRAHLFTFNLEPISIGLHTDYPAVTAEDIQSDRRLIDSYLNQTPIRLSWNGDGQDHQWEFNRTTVASWLSYESGTLSIHPKALEQSLQEISAVITIDAPEPRWTVVKDENGKLVDIQPMAEIQTGRTIHYKQTANAIMAALKAAAAGRTSTAEAIPITVKEKEPAFTAENIHDLGMSDLLGTGQSNTTTHTSVNRRKNIQRGVDALNGMLIAPGEEFSLLRVLRPFTYENGYVSELVIKGDRTTPEIGGGLCQVGSTLFRAAMNSGLDITARTNHSFAVSYYNDPRNGQPGTDATIYDPAPDFKFINDSGNYILLQTRMEGNDLYFDVWGKNDGRVGSYTAPTTYNWISPPPMKEIPSTELAPGQRKCTENAFAGVTAEFTYNIVYGDGSTHAEVFKSVYKPWQAVCLVGVDPNAQQTPVDDDTTDDNPTNTNNNTNANTNSNSNANTNKNTNNSNSNTNKKK
ncbi:MAG: VanW family protein [Candidatus Kerfeldbacteria bacterium]|nr:VanW family protein [Candidatus Kerfeldbacteria bacterium]